MFRLCLFICLLEMLMQTNCFGLTYIVKKDKHEILPSCIAEGNQRYKGIAWIYPIPSSNVSQPKSESSFIPSIKNEFNCKFFYNSQCSIIWTIKNWQIDENSSRTFDYINDERWEEFPTIFISKETKEFKDRFDLPNEFKVGFSVRATGNVELFLCEGWNPLEYPCYYFNISMNDIFLSKYLSFPASNTSTLLDSYKVYTRILSKDEWRNFIVAFDEFGKLQLIDVNLNRTVVDMKDEHPLKPVYLFFRSTLPSLWKVHQNQFFYTKSAQTYRLGPKLNLESTNLCVALYVSTCENCVMIFFFLEDGTKRFINQEQPERPNTNEKWRFIRLRGNILADQINIFVETTYINKSNTVNGFWAIDNVRVCHENEVRITSLKSTIDETDDELSCQAVEQSNLRPKKIVVDQVKEFPKIETTPNSTSIALKWTMENSIDPVEYFISYQAIDTCEEEPHNLERSKSNGFLVTKLNQILLQNLIPYTQYNITFSTMLHTEEKYIVVYTLDKDSLTPDELPNKVKIQETDRTVQVSWDKVNCLKSFGHVTYTLNLIEKSTDLSVYTVQQTENTREIKNLKPFTSYKLQIITSRKSILKHNGKKSVVELEFTTKAGLAGVVKNLEIYSSSSNKLSLRYDLPLKHTGQPVDIQLTRCNPIILKKCKSSISHVTPCGLFPGKYCIEADNLIPNLLQTIKISVKNDGTNTFGEETIVKGFTEERIPGPPTNITYRIVDCDISTDYCHLNVSWLHPYMQNGTITAFNIVLNSTQPKNDSKEYDSIHEVFKITNQSYLPQYTHQIKYVPYSQQYDLYIQSANMLFKSEFVMISLKTTDLGDHIDQSPTLMGKTEDSVIFTVTPLDRRLQSGTMKIVIQDFNKSETVSDEILHQKQIAENLCHKFGNTWISQIVKIEKYANNFTIGDGDQSKKALKPDTKYCAIFIITNSYRNSTHDVVYYDKFETLPHVEDVSSSGSSSKHLYILLVLLIIIPIAFIIYWYLRKRRIASNRIANSETEYETLPFEDTAVNNNFYNELEHK